MDAGGTESAASAVVTATTVTAPAQASFAVTKQLVISLADQRVYFIQDGRVVNIIKCSTGAVPGSTPTGSFRILFHDEVVPIREYPGTVCYYWMGFTSNHGIHAWPAYNGQYSDYSGLGRPASHGCVRLHPDEAPWAYNWTPDGTPLTIIAESFMPLPPPLDDGHVSLGTDTPSKTWYFAEGYTGGSFTEYIPVLNANDTPANVHAECMTTDGSVFTCDLMVPANSRGTIMVDGITGLASAEVSVKLTSDVEVVAERAMYFDYNGLTGGHASLGATAPATKWYIAEGCTKTGFHEYVLLLNPEGTATTANIRFMTGTGGVIDQTVDLPARSRRTIYVNDVAGLSSADVSARITSGGPIVVERSMYFDYGGLTGGHVSLASQILANEWYFAEGCTLEGFQEYILVQNPHNDAVTVDATFMLEGGTTVTRSYGIAPHTRFTIWVNNEPGCSDASLAASISSATLPVLAERSMYFSLPGRNGGHNAVGASAPSQLWYFAEGYTAGSFDQFVLLQNPPVGYNYQVPAHGRVTVHVDETPGLEACEVSTRVSSDRPVIAERAVYFCIPREREF